MTQDERNQARSMVQGAAYRAWENKGRKGTIVMATGVGKSRLAIGRVKNIVLEWLPESSKPVPKVLLVTPTEKLRDENWPEEFARWNCIEEMDTVVKRICFASLKNEKGNQYKLVILDEVHRLTESNAEGFRDGDSLITFFAENMAEEVMGLTATEPDPKRDMMKWSIFEQIAPVCFRYTLDQAVDDGILSEYQIKIIHVPLDRIAKVIPAGTKAKPFMNTELAAYEYLDKLTKKAQASKKVGWAQAMQNKRRLFISNLPSKVRVAEALIKKVVHTEKKRTIIFCGGIDISRKLCGGNVYNSSKEDKPRDMLTTFKEGKINYLGVVDAVNEGHNIPGIEEGIIHQLNSNPRDLIQRMGRVLRGEKPVIYIIVAQGTRDEFWCREAISELDQKRITYESYMTYLRPNI